MTFPHQPGLASSPWPPTPTPIPEGWLSGHGHGEFLPSTAIRSRRGADVHSQGGQAPGLGRDPRGCPPPAQPSKGGEAWEPGPWRDQHKARRAAIGSWQEDKTFFFFFPALIDSREKDSMAPGQANSCQPSGGGEQNPFFLQVLEPSARPSHWLVFSQLSWHPEVCRSELPGPIEGKS